MLHRVLPVALVIWLSLTNGALADQTFTDVTIDCEPTGVVLTVNSTALQEEVPGLDLETLRVGEGPWPDQCRPQDVTEHGRGIKSFHFLYGDCRPQVEELTNTILRLTYDVIGDVSDQLESSFEGAKATCLIPKDGLIEAHIGEDTNIYQYAGSPEGPFQLDITIYKDSFMTVPVTKDEEISLGMPLWVGVKLNSSGNSEMFVKDCWATPNPTNTADQPEHVFIKKGLIGEDDETFNPVDDVITASTYGFSFDSFMFRGAGNRIYIKCHVYVCDPYVTDSDQSACSIPKYPEFHVSARDIFLGNSGSGSGFGINTRDVGEEEENADEFEDPRTADENEEDADEAGAGMENSEGVSKRAVADDDVIEADLDVPETEHSVYYIMNSFQVKHVERKRRSAGSYRIYPRHTMFSNLRSGIMLGIIIASTAMFSACAILLPLHLSGEKVRCLHVKPVKRVV